MNYLVRGIFLMAAALCAIRVTAAPVNCSGNGSFVDLLATNAVGGCYIENQLFTNFKYLSSASGADVTPVSASNFHFSTVANVPEAVGFQFGFTLTALPNTSGNISIGWVVKGPNILSSHLLLDAVATGNAVAIAQTTYCKGGPVAGCPADSLSQLTTYKGVIGTNVEDSQSFSPVEILGVSTSISVFATGGGSATITGLRETVDPPSSVPEPASLAITGVALLTFGLKARRRSNFNRALHR